MNNLVNNIESIKEDGNLSGDEINMLKEISNQEEKEINKTFLENNINKNQFIDVILNAINKSLENRNVDDSDKKGFKKLGLNIISKLDNNIDQNDNWEKVVNDLETKEDEIDDSDDKQESNIEKEGRITMSDFEKIEDIIIDKDGDIKDSEKKEFINNVSIFLNNSDDLERYCNIVEDNLELDGISMAGLLELISFGEENISKFLENDKSKDFLKDYLQSNVPTMTLGDKLLPSMYGKLLDSEKITKYVGNSSRYELESMDKDDISLFFNNEGKTKKQYELLSKGPRFIKKEDAYIEELKSYWNISKGDININLLAPEMNNINSDKREITETLISNMDYDLLNNIKANVLKLIEGGNVEDSFDSIMRNMNYMEFDYDIEFSDYLSSIVDSAKKGQSYSFDFVNTTDAYMKYLEIEENGLLGKLNYGDVADISDVFPEAINKDQEDFEKINNAFKNKLLSAFNDFKDWQEENENGDLANFLHERIFIGKEAEEDKPAVPGIINDLDDEYNIFDEKETLDKYKKALEPTMLKNLIIGVLDEAEHDENILKLFKDDKARSFINDLYGKHKNQYVNLYLNNINNKDSFNLEFVKGMSLSLVDECYRPFNNKFEFDLLGENLVFDLDEDEKNIFDNWIKKLKNVDSEDGIEKIIKINKVAKEQLKNKNGEKWNFSSEGKINGLLDHFSMQLSENMIVGSHLSNGEKEFNNMNKESEHLLNIIDASDNNKYEVRRDRLKNYDNFDRSFNENNKNISKPEPKSVTNSSNTGTTSNFEGTTGNKNYAVSKKTDKNGKTIGWSLKLGDNEDSEVIEVEKKENINDNVRIIEKLLERKGIDVDLVSKDRSKSMEASIFDKYKKIQDLSESPEKIDFELIEGAIMQGIRKWVVDKVDNTKKDDLKVPANTMSKIKSSQTNRSIEGLSEFFAKLKTTQKDWKDKNNMYYDAVSADDVGTSNGLIVMIEELENMNTIDEVYSMANSSL